MSGSVSDRFWGSESEMSAFVELPFEWWYGEIPRAELGTEQAPGRCERHCDVITPCWGVMLNYNCYLTATPPRTVLELNNFQLLMPRLTSMQEGASNCSLSPTSQAPEQLEPGAWSLPPNLLVSLQLVELLWLATQCAWNWPWTWAYSIYCCLQCLSVPRISLSFPFSALKLTIL